MSFIIYSILFLLLFSGFSLIRTAYADQIPKYMINPSWFSSEELERAKARIGFVVFGAIMTIVVSTVTYGFTKSIALSLSTVTWHGLLPHPVLGSTGMMLGAGLIRLTLLKQLPKAAIPWFLRGPYRRRTDAEKAHERARLLLFTGGVYLSGIGVIFYYLV